MTWGRTAFMIGSLALVSCVGIGDYEPEHVIPDYDAGYPASIIHVDEKLSLANPTGYTNLVEDQTISGEATPEPEQPYVLRNYRVGPPRWDLGQDGGLTITVVGTGDPVCVIIDPENTKDDDCDYNDADFDLFAGAADEYTGVIGESIGSFQSSWTDDLGIAHVTDTNYCAKGSTEILPPGRAQPETCAFATEADVEYTVLLRTFGVPLDDYVGNVAVLLQPGHKGTVACVLPTSGSRYLVNSAEDLDESDAAYGAEADLYSDLRDPCYCPIDETERADCGFE